MQKRSDVNSLSIQSGSIVVKNCWLSREKNSIQTENRVHKNSIQTENRLQNRENR